jgi:glycosyltransferase involved in cell wall biosynthesis
MRIGLNAIGFTPGAMGGVETYFRQLLHHLQADNERDDYLVVCKNTDVDSFNLNNPRFNMKVYPIGRPSLQWFVRGVLFEVAHVDIIKASMNQLPVDVLHHPFTILEPLGLKIPSVLTFWDMQQEFYPGFFSRKEKRFRNFTYPASAQQATRIIVSSNFTRKCLVERYNVHPDKIDVIYTGIGDEYFPITSPEVLSAVNQRYNLPDVFIYYPAALWPHKNHRTLLDALCLIRDRYGLDVNLVLSGMSAGRGRELQTELLKRNLLGTVTVLGYIPYEELPCLYNLATLMVYPSLFEGFGIPLVEAMASGCPVVCSDSTSIPEVVGSAALLFDPLSVDEMASRIFSALNDRELRQKMSSAGLKQALRYNWSETARQTRAVYEKACG